MHIKLNNIKVHVYILNLRTQSLFCKVTKNVCTLEKEELKIRPQMYT